MSGSGTGGGETTGWTDYQSLLASANVLSPTGSSDDGAGRRLWFPSDGVETVALRIGAGQTALRSEGSAFGTPPNGNDWRADAGERSGAGEQTSPAGDSLRPAGDSLRNEG